MAAAWAAEIPAPVMVGVELSMSWVRGKMRPPPPPWRLHDGGIVRECGWVNNLAVAMEQRLIASCIGVVLKTTVG